MLGTAQRTWCNRRSLTSPQPKHRAAFAPFRAVNQKQQEGSTSAAAKDVVQDVLTLRQKLQLYNTMSRAKEVFTTRPETPNRVQMYVCGVTVYDYSHIGHARVYVAFDVLYRFLKHLGYDVQYVRNFTDIDDKIINRANERGEDPLALSGRFIDEFHVDMKHLGCLRPDAEPKATDYIPQMIKTIEQIISNGHAYAVPDGSGDVFFDVNSLPGYGKLSGRLQDDNRAGERVDVDARKRGPADFALWKGAKAGEPAWPSPWGPGRPGWHIECSSMIADVMGPVIDIHGGGQDLVFPHHENELAQSKAAAGPCSCGHDHGHTHASSSTGANGSSSPDFVRYWLHNGFVNVDSEKMSKSLGNFFTIRDVLKQYHPMALRWFLVSQHYRAPVNYTQRALEEASDRLYYVYQALLDVQAALAGSADGEKARAQAAQDFGSGAGPGPATVAAAVQGLLDDLNTPSAVSALSGPLKSINDLLTTKAGKKQADRLQVLAHHELALCTILGLLGLISTPAPTSTTPNDTARAATAGAAAAAAAAIAEMKALALRRMGLTEADVQLWIQERAEARAAKDFARGDALRVQMAERGVLIMDTPTGTSWRPGVVAAP